MAQTGLFVTALSYTTSIYKGIYTHFMRKEDIKIKSGKLDEELKRIKEIIDIFNESFSSTNKRESSEIARHIVKALLENNIKIAFVTHLYEPFI